MVVGTGFEPVNGEAERIYSPRPLATWIPYLKESRNNVDFQHLCQAFF